jgi:hypothetical protein
MKHALVFLLLFAAAPLFAGDPLIDASATAPRR